MFRRRSIVSTGRRPREEPDIVESLPIIQQDAAESLGTDPGRKGGRIEERGDGGGGLTSEEPLLNNYHISSSYVGRR
jgi:hypothetical protein